MSKCRAVQIGEVKRRGKASLEFFYAGRPLNEIEAVVAIERMHPIEECCENVEETD